MIMVMIEAGNQKHEMQSIALCLLWLLSMMVSFLCQLGCVTVLRYLVKHFECFCEGVFFHEVNI